MRQRNFNEFSEHQKACYEMLSEWAGGDHHLPTVHECGTGVCINWAGALSTFDWSRLTRLVLLAHRDAIRIEIASSGPRMVRIIAHKREHKPDGRIYERHPSLADLVAEINKMMPSTGEVER